MADAKPQSRLISLAALAGVGLAVAAGVVWWASRGPRPTPVAASPEAALAAAASPASPPAEPKLGAQATLSSAVVQAMVTGNAALSRGTPADLLQARAAFEQAIKLDERYAPAHAGLTHALVRLADSGAERPGAILPKAIEHGDLAVELDPASALGWYALARAEVLWTRDWSRAEMHYQRAIQLDPKAEAPAAWLAELLAAVARPTEAVEQSERAVALDPRSAALLMSAGQVRYLTGDYPKALEYLRQAREAGVRGVVADVWLARTHAAMGALDDAAAAAKQAAVSGPSWVMGYVQALTGRGSEAEQVLAAIGARAAGGYVPALEYAYIRTGLRQNNEALSFVETAVREHSPGSELLQVDPIFAGLRSEPRFRAALAELKLGAGR
jgi:tetratricopeptide (TPR) repeat protein